MINNLVLIFKVLQYLCLIYYQIVINNLLLFLKLKVLLCLCLIYYGKLHFLHRSKKNLLHIPVRPKKKNPKSSYRQKFFVILKEMHVIFYKITSTADV